MHFVLASSISGLLLPALVSGFAVEPAEETAGRLEQARVAGLAAPAPTSPPKRRWAELFNRAINSDKTCGYFHYYDDPDEDTYPITCADDGFICTVSGRLRGCCDPTYGCSTVVFATTCLDYFNCPYLSTAWPTGTKCCDDSEYPYCVTNLWSTDPKDVYTFFACHRSSTSRLGIMEAYSDGDPSSITTSPTTTPTTTTPEPTPEPTTPSPTPDPNDGGGSNTGAIVGGVVGGVAVVGLAGLAILFLVKKKKRDDNPPPPQQQAYDPSAQPPPMASPPQQQQPMASQQTAMSQPYDPRQSYFGANQSPPGYPSVGAAASPTSPYAGSSAASPPPPMGAKPGGVSPQQPQYAVAGTTPEKGGFAEQPHVMEVPANNPRGMVGGNNPVEMSG